MRNQHQFIEIVLAVSLAALALTGCDEAEGQLPSRETKVGQGQGQQQVKANGVAINVTPGPGGALMAGGVRLKVVVGQDTSLFDQPRGKAIGPKAQMFDMLYVHEARMLEDDTWFLVSRTPEDGSAISWIPNRMARVWRHRVGFRPVLIKGSYVLQLPIYESAADATDALRGSVSPRPIAVFDLVPEDDEGPMPCNPWPILEKRSVLVDGKEVQVYRVAMLGKKANSGNSPKPRYTEAELDQFQAQLQQLDFMVCMDGTGSMTRWIKSTREAVAAFSRKIAGMDSKPDVSAFLTIYRDDSDGKDIVRHYGPETVDEFCKTIGTVKARGGDSDMPEAGLEGLMQCLQRMTYRPRSQRILLLVGDTPHHLKKGPSNPNGYTLSQVASEAKTRKITIFALSVGPAWPERDHQFQTIAEGTGGRLLSINDIGELEGEVQKLLTQQATIIHETMNVYTALRDGHTEQEIASTMGRSPEQISYVVEILRKTKDIDPDRIGPRGCMALEGWIAPSCGSARAGELEVFCFKSEAGKVLDVLRKLHRLEPGLDIGAKVWDAAARSRTQSGATIGENFAEMVLPHRGSSILSYTPTELAQLSEQKRAVLRDDTYMFIRSLNRALTDNRRWYRQTSN